MTRHCIIHAFQRRGLFTPLALALLMACTQVQAQTISDSAKGDSTKVVKPDTATGILAGLVTNAETDSPFGSGASVWIQGTGLGRRTNSYGYFDFFNVPPGQYTVLVERIGYKTDTLRNVIIRSKLTTVVSSELRLSQQGMLTGLVTDAETGKGHRFAEVRIQGTEHGGTTDSTGFYWIINIPPGKYTVKATALGYTTDTNKNVKIYSGRLTKSDFKIKQLIFGTP